MADYLVSSPWFLTQQNNGVLDILEYRSIPAAPDDLLYQIDHFYEYRPDLLAHDQYADTKLWWVFAVRNPGLLIDPVWDFKSGTTIYLPKFETLKSYLGV